MVNTASGLPICQPLGKTRGAGRSASSPRGVPASTQARSVALSPSDSTRSLRHWPYFGSACQGGIRPSSMTSRTVSAQALASS